MTGKTPENSENKKDLSRRDFAKWGLLGAMAAFGVATGLTGCGEPKVKAEPQPEQEPTTTPGPTEPTGEGISDEEAKRQAEIAEYQRVSNMYSGMSLQEFCELSTIDRAGIMKNAIRGSELFNLLEPGNSTFDSHNNPELYKFDPRRGNENNTPEEVFGQWVFMLQQAYRPVGSSRFSAENFAKMTSMMFYDYNAGGHKYDDHRKVTNDMQVGMFEDAYALEVSGGDGTGKVIAPHKFLSGERGLWMDKDTGQTFTAVSIRYETIGENTGGPIEGGFTMIWNPEVEFWQVADSADTSDFTPYSK